MYLTRGNTSPNNKPKIMIVSAPEDHERYYEKIARCFLESRNCAVISYVEFRSIEPAEFDNRLKGEISLIVVLVTDHIFGNESDVYEMISKANMLYIPVLPILCEQISDYPAYNSFFENRQFLSPDDQDDTAIPFSKKLDDYLTKIFSDDETILRIEREFDRKIFLSYRKKNRAYANILFETIHSDPALYDVAIWYDEFISGGSDFEDAIRSAMNNCDVYLLCVTEDLLEDNYVLNYEYPYALKHSIPVIPVEMSVTDKDLLYRKYTGLCKVIPFTDAAMLLSALKVHLGETKLFSDEHYYYIGLAYLNSKYVEYSPERAFELISKAAELGLPEAAGKLSEMYEEGQGVSRSFEEAIKMRKLQVELIAEKLRQDPDNVYYREMFFKSNLTLGNDLLREGRAREAVNYFRNLNAGSFTSMNNVMLNKSAVGLMGAGMAEMQLGEYDLAEKHLTHVVEARHKLLNCERVGSLDYIICRRALAAAYHKLGDCLLAERKLTDAMTCFEKCLYYRRQAYKEVKSGDMYEYEARRDLAVILLKAADTFLTYLTYFQSTEELLKMIHTYFDESNILRRELYNELRTDNAKRDYGVGCRYLGEFELKYGRMQDAIQYIEEAEKMLVELADHTDSLDDKYKSAEVYRVKSEYYVKLYEENENIRNYALLADSYQKYKKSLQRVLDSLPSSATTIGDEWFAFYIEISMKLLHLLIDMSFLHKSIGNDLSADRCMKENIELLQKLEPYVNLQNLKLYLGYAEAIYRTAGLYDYPANAEFLKTVLIMYGELMRHYPQNQSFVNIYERILHELQEIMP